jgi:hypothetical protein
MVQNDRSHRFCSWCYEFTAHDFAGNSRLRRKVYRCAGCGKPTVQCLYCADMARGSEKSFGWNDQLCAAHNGSIPSFRQLSARLDCIADYKKLYKREKTNLLRVGKVAGSVIVGGTMLAPAALIAAPAIGGVVGSWFMGLSGAAATNAGLAALGGGSLALGGFGMAGGAAVVTACGTALGGALGGRGWPCLLWRNRGLRDQISEGRHWPCDYHNQWLFEPA